MAWHLNLEAPVPLLTVTSKLLNKLSSHFKMLHWERGEREEGFFFFFFEVLPWSGLDCKQKLYPPEVSLATNLD